MGSSPHIGWQRSLGLSTGQQQLTRARIRLIFGGTVACFRPCKLRWLRLQLLNSPEALVFSRQLYFTGVESSGIVILAASLIGFGFVYAVENSLDAVSGARALEFLALLSAKNLGVVTTGIVFVARSITAISSELALMRVNGELKTLERLGIDSTRYLLIPRVLASAVATSILSVYFLIASLFAANLAQGGRLDLLSIERVVNSLPPVVVFSGFIRAGIFAGVSVLWIQRYAIRRRRSFTEVPIGTSLAVLHSIVLILVLEAIYQLFTFAPFPV